MKTFMEKKENIIGPTTFLWGPGEGGRHET